MVDYSGKKIVFDKGLLGNSESSVGDSSVGGSEEFSNDVVDSSGGDSLYNGGDVLVDGSDGLLDDLLNYDSDEDDEVFSSLLDDDGDDDSSGDDSSGVSGSDDGALGRVVDNVSGDSDVFGDSGVVDAFGKPFGEDLSSFVRGERVSRRLGREERIRGERLVDEAEDVERSVRRVGRIADADSGFRRVGGVELVVGDDGRVVGDGYVSGSSLLNDDGDDSSGDDSSSGVPDSWLRDDLRKYKYSYLSVDGRLNLAELNFYKSLGVSKSVASRDVSLMSLLRGPRGRGFESREDRAAREKVFAKGFNFRRVDMRRGSRDKYLTFRDFEVLVFLAKFKFAKAKHVGTALGVVEGTALKRLRRLRLLGLVMDFKWFGNPLWYVTSLGMIVSGYDLPRMTGSRFTPSMFNHQFTVNHVASNLWGGQLNVLGLDDYPAKNHLFNGREFGGTVGVVDAFGESLVSELELLSSFGKFRLFGKADDYLPVIRSQMESDFRVWENAGGVEFGDSPEFYDGNEYMWVLFPPATVRLRYHVPDLVVRRSRNVDGSPNSIAVEVEVSNKDEKSYAKTLRAYKADRKIYGKVIWVCQTRGTAIKLENIAKEIGLWQEGRIEIISILDKDGVFADNLYNI